MMGFAPVNIFGLDPDMLRTVVGRDLLMIAGSEETYFLFQKLFGYARTRSFSGEGDLGNSSSWPTLRHPQACIDVRVRAYFLANLLWNCMRCGEHRPLYFVRIVSAARNSIQAGDESKKAFRITDRWPVDQHDRWMRLFARG
jgi:hypothetical protein